MPRILRYAPALLMLVAGGVAFLVARRLSTLPDGIVLDRMVETVTRTPRHPLHSKSAPSSPRTLEIFSSARPEETILRFPDSESYLAALATPLAAGLEWRGQLDRLETIRLHYTHWASLAQWVAALGYSGFSEPPPAPSVGLRSDGVDSSQALGFERNSVDWLGVPGRHPQWGAGVRIAIIDSGVVAHPELRPATESIEIVPFPQDLSKTHPHGTSVASVIQGQGPRINGLAPAAEIISIRAIDDEGQTDAYDFAAALLAAIDARVDLVNLSVGSLTGSSLEADAVQQAIDAGIVVVAAAGNDAHDHLRFPAAYPGVISVGAIDAGGERMAFSNTGDHLAIVAPGVAMLTAAPGNGYILTSGTSVSAPLVTAAIAATMSDGSGRHLSARQAADLVLSLTDDMGPAGRDPEYGFGILNLSRIMNRSTMGIVDACLTDQRLVRNATGQLSLRVTVQNRGTATLTNILVRIEPTGSLASIGLLKAGAVHSLDFPLGEFAPSIGLPVTFTSQITLSQGAADISQEDHQLTTRIFAP
ncbi:F0F1-type ATP synthase membrane subunit c/vacuolar-type H+-ATPase subunit K [Haloferula luteola]|uniref:F0F1-type ATP synthase membrane subunit c/vacuolar-type H+-ATPase subunit K n=1 Tax=Haloferula luteola TaxID=595692 RepID=A0A840UY76_9BACT|nr:S8 family serine peptidase [Haloferula luteola]MBB5350732.1 F0F1-type ATP synthase membrane subunit c/vacuolar-type H+-ATPase subunit K [Haloferula luteola]